MNLLRHRCIIRYPTTTHGMLAATSGLTTKQDKLYRTSQASKPVMHLALCTLSILKILNAFTYLRLLLYEVKCPSSFEDYPTVDATICETYKQASQLSGLLEEGAATRSSWMLRNLFAIMLQQCAMSNPQQLWDNHKANLAGECIGVLLNKRHN